MSRAEHRVEQLELLTALEHRVSYADFRDKSDAYRQLRAALMAVLPETLQETYRYGPGDMYTGVRGPLVTYAMLLPPIVDRIRAGTTTDDDQRILDALPVDALTIFRTSAVEFLEIVSRMHTDF